MKKTIFIDTQIIKVLKDLVAGMKNKDIRKALGISRAKFFNWKIKEGGMDAYQLKKLIDLKEENQRLKHMYTDLSFDHELLKLLFEKKH